VPDWNETNSLFYYFNTLIPDKFPLVYELDENGFANILLCRYCPPANELLDKLPIDFLIEAIVPRRMLDVPLDLVVSGELVGKLIRGGRKVYSDI
jgi:hypothetical protein